MVTQLEVHQAEQKYFELKRLLEAEKAPLDPVQVRAAIRCGDRNFEAIRKILWELCPDLCRRHDLEQFIPF